MLKMSIYMQMSQKQHSAYVHKEHSKLIELLESPKAQMPQHNWKR